MYSTTIQVVAKVTAGRLIAFSQRIESLLFVRCLTHTDVSVESAAKVQQQCAFRSAKRALARL